MTLPTAYRDCVGICLINRTGQVFVGERRDRPADAPVAWQMPQGGVDEGESPEDAAWREMLEEIGTNKATLLASTDDWLHYDLPEDMIGRLWGGKYRGQRQLWFLFAFDGADADINIQTDAPEFQAWKWTGMDDLVAEIVPFKREIYSSVVDSFREQVELQRLGG